MSGPTHATTTNRGRFYTWRDENYWSVTTIISGGVPKPALINWAKKFTAEYACDNYEKLGALLAPDADGYVDRGGAVDWLKDASFRDRDRKADLGTRLHEAIEAYTLGKPFPKWTIDIEWRMKAFERFLARYEPDYDMGMAEATVFSRTQKYAGTLDAVFEIGRGPHKGRRVLNDYKSSQRGIFPEVALQLSAYRRADFVAGPDWSELPMPEVDTATALWLPDNADAELYEVSTDDAVFRSFLYVREVYRWQLELSKKAILGPVKSEPPEAAPAEQQALANSLSQVPSP